MDVAALRDWFGASFDAVDAYRAMLADEGVRRGLIGPREVDRLWERHILNSAAVTPFLPERGSVVDIGSGAGLPGVVLAAMRPDLEVVLLEPMIRRTTWLTEVLDVTGIRAEVIRGRAEELHGHRTFDVATARAVAPMDRLATWALPLVEPGGELIALKGRTAQEELDAAGELIARYGGADARVVDAPTLPDVDTTAVVRVRRTDAPVPVDRPSPATQRTTDRPARSGARSRRAARRRRRDG